MNINRAELSGNLVRPPEVRATKTGSYLAAFTIAVDEGFGEKKRTNFIDCTKFLGKEPSPSALSFWQGLDRGRHIVVAGHIRQRKYEKNGENRYAVEVIVDDIDAGPRAQGSSSSAANAQAPSNNQHQHPQDDMYDDVIPF